MKYIKWNFVVRWIGDKFHCYIMAQKEWITVWTEEIEEICKLSQTQNSFVPVKKKW